MRYVNKILAALLVLAIFYLGYLALNLRTELFAVYDVPDKYALANDNYDIVVVDFNSYGCGHCQALHPVLMEAIKRDGKVKYISRPISFNVPWSEELAASVYAAAEQGKFIEMHNMIYDRWPINDKETLLKNAKDIGLDIKKLSRDMSKSKIIAHVRENQKFFDEWGLTRTPTLLMDKKAIYSPADETPSVEELLEKFNLIRE